MEELEQGPRRKREILPPRRCIFCGGSPISREHLFPAWMKPYLAEPKEPRTHHHVRFENLFTGEVNLSEGQLHRPGDHRSRRLKVVCKKCNETWMSTLQSDAKPHLLPLLQGEWRALTPRDVAIVAAWAAMFTMVAEHMEPRLVAVTQKDRDYLRSHRRAPPDWLIWIGCFNGQANDVGTWHRAWSFGVDSRKPEDSVYTLQTTVFAAGRVIFKAFSTAVDLPSANLSAIKSGAVAAGMRRLWPRNATGSLIYRQPPARAIDDTGFVDLVMRTDDVVRAISLGAGDRRL